LNGNGAKRKILLVDDDAALTRIVALGLEAERYEVHCAANGLEGLQSLYRWQPDIIVLDVNMPRLDGWETCRRIREVSDVPVLMLTGRDDEEDEIRGLRGGADMYMAKPFVLPVLVARIEALLRRAGSGAEPTRPRSQRFGQLAIDLLHRTATMEDRQLELTPTEFRLLAALAARPGEVVEHRALLTSVWGPGCVDEDVYLKLYICYLRQKIEPDPGHPTYIITKRGVGYSLGDGSPRPSGKRGVPNSAVRAVGQSTNRHVPLQAVDEETPPH
jgi:two-component system, OmpR family, KDP operon response regulator KdpE